MIDKELKKKLDMRVEEFFDGDPGVINFMRAHSIFYLGDLCSMKRGDFFELCDNLFSRHVYDFYCNVCMKLNTIDLRLGMDFDWKFPEITDNEFDLERIKEIFETIKNSYDQVSDGVTTLLSQLQFEISELEESKNKDDTEEDDKGRVEGNENKNLDNIRILFSLLCDADTLINKYSKKYEHQNKDFYYEINEIGRSVFTALMYLRNCL